MASKRDEVSATYSATSQGLDTSRTFGRQGKKGLRGLRAPISAAAKAKGVQLIDEFRAEAVDLEMPRPQLVARARTKLRAAAARKGQLGRWARDRLGAIDVAEAGLKRDFDVLKPEPALALPPEAQHDFTTLIRDEPVGTRTPLLMAPRSKPYEPGTFADAPQLTPYVPIIWDIYGGGGGAVQHFNVRVDERSIMRGSERPPPHIRGEKGILLLDANGVLISARFPRFGGAALPPLEQREGKAISQEAARLRNPTSRGDEKAGYGILFAVTSDKRGQDEQIVMPMCDAQLSAHDQHAWVQLYKRQRAWYESTLHPKFMKYFAAELSLTELFFREREMATYVHGANGTTIGACYTNAQHADDHDMGYTMLPALGSPSRGGHFVHGAHGRTQHVEQGDLLFVNPWVVHGTSEFGLEPGDHPRVMFAFFTKADTASGLGAARAHVLEKGLDIPKASCKRKRRGHGGGHGRGRGDDDS